MSKTYIIPAGGHYAQGLHVSGVVGNTFLHFRAKFYPNCIYHPRREPEQINKLYGMAYGQHHDCSARIGWRSDGSRIEVLSYVYVAPGKRVSDSLGFVDVQEWHDFYIRRLDKVVYVSMDQSTPFKYTLQSPISLGYRLFPYFGGEDPAPHEMWIEIEVVEMNGIGA